MKLIEDLGVIYTSETKKYKHRFGIYECPYCSNKFKAQCTHIVQGGIKSCGCLLKNNTRFLKHGKSGNNKLYRTWKNMRQRCLNKNNKSYENYGGRGISICDEWKNDYIKFYNWSINNGYEDNFTIDRINNDGNYEPNNCRWTIKNIQARNTRAIMITNTSGYRGVTFCKRDNLFIAKINIDKKRIVLGYFKNKLDAAKAYDTYVLENNLEHTINGVIDVSK